MINELTKRITMEDNQLKACRAEFEKWATCDKTRQRKANGYAYATTNTLWKGWQAAYTRPQANTEARDAQETGAAHTGLLETIESQKQTHDALIKKVKIATDVLEDIKQKTHWGLMQNQPTYDNIFAKMVSQIKEISIAALSQIQQGKLCPK